MKRTLPLLPVVFALFFFGWNTRVTSRPVHPAFAFADSFFTGKSFRFDERYLYFPSDYNEIAAKFQAAINKDLEWYKQYTNKYGEFGEKLPYHERLGITKAEFERYKLLSKNSDSLQWRSRGLRTIGIIRNKGVIHLKDTGLHNRFNDLLIDLNQETVTVDGKTLGKPETVQVKEKNVYGEWQGYGWQLESMAPSQKVPGSLSGQRIFFTLGRTNRNQGILLLYFLRVEDGVTVESFDAKGLVGN